MGGGRLGDSRLDVQPGAGKLVELLEGQYQGQITPAYAVNKARKYQSYRIRALLNHLEQSIKEKNSCERHGKAGMVGRTAGALSACYSHDVL